MKITFRSHRYDGDELEPEEEGEAIVLLECCVMLFVVVCCYALGNRSIPVCILPEAKEMTCPDGEIGCKENGAHDVERKHALRASQKN